MSRAVDCFAVCGLSASPVTVSGDARGFVGAEERYLPEVLSSYPSTSSAGNNEDVGPVLAQLALMCMPEGVDVRNCATVEAGELCTADCDAMLRSTDSTSTVTEGMPSCGCPERRDFARMRLTPAWFSEVLKPPACKERDLMPPCSSGGRRTSP